MAKWMVAALAGLTALLLIAVGVTRLDLPGRAATGPKWTGLEIEMSLGDESAASDDLYIHSPQRSVRLEHPPRTLARSMQLPRPTTSDLREIDTDCAELSGPEGDTAVCIHRYDVYERTEKDGYRYRAMWFTATTPAGTSVDGFEIRVRLSDGSEIIGWDPLGGDALHACQDLTSGLGFFDFGLGSDYTACAGTDYHGLSDIGTRRFSATWRGRSREVDGRLEGALEWKFADDYEMSITLRQHG